ncbi:MAG: hypothetical protein ACPIOQ_76035, partial [Promethearchaeia archaeon]
LQQKMCLEHGREAATCPWTTGDRFWKTKRESVPTDEDALEEMKRASQQNDTSGSADGPAAIDVVFLDIDGVLLPFDPAEDSSDEEDRVPCSPPYASVLRVRLRV